jgi:hypothetical protein
MGHGDIRTIMNIYGDIVTDEMAVANSKVAGLELSLLQADRKASRILCFGGSEWESNPPATGKPAARRF